MGLGSVVQIREKATAPLVWLGVLGCFLAWGYVVYQKEFRRALAFLECRKDWRSTGEYCSKMYQSKTRSV